MPRSEREPYGARLRNLALSYLGCIDPLLLGVDLCNEIGMIQEGEPRIWRYNSGKTVVVPTQEAYIAIKSYAGLDGGYVQISSSKPIPRRCVHHVVVARGLRINGEAGSELSLLLEGISK